MSASLERGIVVNVRFDPTEGREIRKTPPAIVVSNDIACRFDAVVQVVPVTTLPDRELRPYEARCGSDASGLAKPSRAVANQIRTVSRNRIGRTIGRLTPDETVALVQHVAAGLGTGEQHGADVPLAELAGDLVHVGHPERALDEEPRQQVAVRRIQPPDVRPLDVVRNRQAPVARREPWIGAPQPRRLRVRRTQPLRVAHGADGQQRLRRGLDRREDDAVRTHVEHLLDHPDVPVELAAGRRNPHDDGLARHRVARRGDRGRIHKPLHPRPQRADVVGAVLHVEENEVDIVVCRQSNGVRARVDRDAEGHLVVVEQPDEAGLGHRLRILLAVHAVRGRRQGEDHDECKPSGDGSHGFSLVVPAEAARQPGRLHAPRQPRPASSTRPPPR